MRQDADVIARNDGRRQAAGRTERGTFAEAKQHRQQQERTDTGKHHVDDTPTAEGQQCDTGRGCDHRDQHHSHRDIGDLRASGVTLEQVAYDGEGYRHARACTCALDDAPCEQVDK
jgi:hypothetical protein